MKERPILFSGPMVRAILDGRKTQTRRVVKPQPLWVGDPGVPFKTRDADPKGIIECPYGQIGDRLWVREAWSGEYWLKDIKPIERLGMPHPDRLVSLTPETWYWADGNPESGDWERPRPSIHMPRWASRITLEITDVRVERLQDISEEDAKREGVNKYDDGPIGGMYVDYEARQPVPADGPIHSFKTLWQSINGPDSWDANPWVWVVEFNRVTGDI